MWSTNLELLNASHVCHHVRLLIPTIPSLPGAYLCLTPGHVVRTTSRIPLVSTLSAFQKNLRRFQTTRTS